MKLLSNNNLLSKNQSEVRSGDFSINHLISITHDIFHSCDSYYLLVIQGFFQDMSKAFDKV